MDEVPVVQRLQAEVAELQVPFGFEGAPEGVEIEAPELRRQQLQLHAPRHERLQRRGVQMRHLGLRHPVVRGVGKAHFQEGERLGTEIVQQQPRRDVRVVRVFLDEGTRRHDERRAHVLFLDAVVHVAAGFGDDALGVDVVQALAGLADQGLDARRIEGTRLAVRADDGERGRGFGRSLGALLLRPDARTFLAVEHVVAGHLVLAGAHQRQFHLVLDVLDVDRAPGREAPPEDLGDLPGQRRDPFADA